MAGLASDSFGFRLVVCVQGTLLWLAWLAHASCPIALPITNVTLPNGKIARGVKLAIGNPGQELAFLPLWYARCSRRNQETDIPQAPE
jgi:hypothetical protein